MIAFLALDGAVFIFVLIFIELRLWEKLHNFFFTLLALHPSNENSRLLRYIKFTYFKDTQTIDEVEKTSAVTNKEDDDVSRERELVQAKPLALLQMENNLVIK